MRQEYNTRVAIFYPDHDGVKVLISQQQSGSIKCSLGGHPEEEDNNDPRRTALREIKEEGFRNQNHLLLKDFPNRLLQVETDQEDSHPSRWFVLPITASEATEFRPGSDVKEITWVNHSEVRDKLTYPEWVDYWDSVLSQAIMAYMT